MSSFTRILHSRLLRISSGMWVAVMAQPGSLSAKCWPGVNPPRSGPSAMPGVGQPGAPEVVPVPVNPGDTAVPIIPSARRDTAGRPIDAADAIVTISFSVGYGKWKVCNGVHYQPGYVLTNAHCALGATSHLVHFGSIWAGFKDGTPIVSTLNCNAAPAPSIARDSRFSHDVAVLRLDGNLRSFRHAVAELDMRGLLFRRAASTDRAVDVRMVQNLATADGVRFQPMRRHVQRRCRLIAAEPRISNYCIRGNTSRQIDVRGVNHNCNSQQQSSGSALFDAEDGVVLALHRGAGAGVTQPLSCAVPIASVVPALKAWGLQNQALE